MNRHSAIAARIQSAIGATCMATGGVALAFALALGALPLPGAAYQGELQPEVLMAAPPGQGLLAACLLGALQLLCVRLWRRGRRGARHGLALLALLQCVTAVLAPLALYTLWALYRRQPPVPASADAPTPQADPA